MSEFWASARWKMALPENVTGVAGGIVVPSGVGRPALTRRDLVKSYPHLARRLFDPQLYLSTLPAVVARKTCANLASYGWFPLTSPLPVFDSGEIKQADWNKNLRSNIGSLWTGQYPTGNQLDASLALAISFQMGLGVDALILPAPLTTNPFSDFAVESDWLRRGLAWAERLESALPRYVTIALSDRAIRGEDPNTHDLLEIILDQVTAHEASGVYLVLEQANEDGYYITHPNTVGALLRLTSGFASLGIPVFANFVGTAGLLLLAAGARAWSTGWYRSERRLRLADFEDSEGRSTPTYYTEKLASEIHLQYDLDRIVDAGLLPRIEDRTTVSEGLLRALYSGQRVSAVPQWAHGIQNIAAATEHFLLAMIRDTAVVAGLPDASARLEYLTRQLERASALARELFQLGNLNPRTSTAHQESWLRAVELANL